MSAHKNWREMFDRIEFYRADIEILRELGHEVVLAGDPRKLDWSADLYYCWWWGHAVFPMVPAKLRGKPIIVTGAFDYATCREDLPGTCYLDRPLWQKLLIYGVLRFADASLFVSQYEFDEVTANLKVHNPLCVPHAIDTAICKPDPTVRREDYLFSISMLSHENIIRKGVLKTIEALTHLAPSHAHVRLVIAGKHGDAHDVLWRKVKELNLEGRVEMPGMISDSQKLQCFRECLAYVQPTLYEGFGVAIGEAVACGTPVVVGAAGAVPEVAGQFARYVDARDPLAIASGIDEMIDCRFDPERQWQAHARIEQKFSYANRREKMRTVLATVARSR